MIVIQRIESVWTKKSRGMPGSNKRNAIPRRLKLPDPHFCRKELFLHEVGASEHCDFKLVSKVECRENWNKYWSLKLVNENTSIRVQFAYEYYWHGMPNRGSYWRRLFTLKTGEYGSLQINGRFTSYSGQFYTQNFVNIGNVSKIDENLFVASEPTYLVDKMVYLF